MKLKKFLKLFPKNTFISVWTTDQNFWKNFYNTALYYGYNCPSDLLKWKVDFSKNFYPQLKEGTMYIWIKPPKKINKEKR